MTVRGIVTLQFVRPRASRMALACALKKTPGPVRVDALPLVPCRTEPVLKIRAVGLTVVNGKWSCGYTDQGMAARQRALEQAVSRSPGWRHRHSSHSPSSTVTQAAAKAAAVACPGLIVVTDVEPATFVLPAPAPMVMSMPNPGAS